jgi:co-chaperonin GroES (HSP10)|tara:strand:- start:2312 stop:2767 length:456 start_codon:yes stop_codon:yes gene_type:complete
VKNKKQEKRKGLIGYNMSEQINFDQLNRKAGYHSAIKANTVTPLHEGVIVSEINFGERTTASGIIIRSDDGTSHGVRPRWGKVYSVGPTQTDVKVGQWIMIEHGRWTRSFDIIGDSGVTTTLWKVEEKSILIVTDEKPLDYGDTNPDAYYG